MGMEKKTLKCWILWLFWGHSSEAKGNEVEGAVCLGCDQFVFKR